MDSQLSHDTTLTVFLGRGRIAHGIRQTLEDFSATGLVRDLVWVDADSFTSSSSEVTYLRLREDGTPQITREPFNVLVARAGKDKLHLGVINVVGFEESQLQSTELAPLTGAIDSILTGRSIQRTNLIVSAVGAPLEGDLPTLKGFTNLMLAPEDSPGPESATVPFHFDQLDNRFTLHCVAGIASLFGLWEGSTNAPVSRLEPASGVTFRLVRAFYRRIDGQDVQAQLKARIFDTSSNPLPRLNRPGHEVSAQYTEDPRAFSSGAAEELLHEFSQRIEGKTTQAMSEKTRRITSGGAIGEFFGIWAKKMVTTPARFGGRILGESTSFIDDTVQSTLYGEGSRIRVGGSAIEEPSGSVSGPMNAQGGRRENQRVQATRELGLLWASYANVAMTLLDANPRTMSESAGQRSYPQVVQEQGTNSVWVAQKSADVIPGPSANFGRDLPVEVKSTIEGGEIAPYDVVGAAEYESKLAHHRHGQQRVIGRVIGDFKQWQKEHSGSFAYFVGRGLMEKREQLQEREQQLYNEVRELEGSRVNEEKTSLLAGVFWWLGWVLMGSVALFAALWVGGNFRTDDNNVPLWDWVRTLNEAPLDTKVWMFSIWVALWLIFWTLQSAVETREEIRFRHRRRVIVSQLQAAWANLESTKKALIRVEVGYRQFLSASQMIGALIEQPFGRIQHGVVESTIPVNTMPDSVVFAEATPEITAVEQLANMYRREIYREGWLDRYVLGGLQEAGQIFEQKTNGKFQVNDVFSTSGAGSQGQLARLAEAVAGEQFQAQDRADDVWQDITEQLRQDTNRGGVDMLSSLQTYRLGERQSAPARLPLEEAVTVGSFNGEIATERGRVDGILELDPKYCTYDRNTNTFDAIGVSEVLVQISRSANQEDVAFRRPVRERLSAEIFQRMPDSEDSQTPAPRMLPSPSPRHQLPGTGEF